MTVRLLYSFVVAQKIDAIPVPGVGITTILSGFYTLCRAYSQTEKSLTARKLRLEAGGKVQSFLDFCLQVGSTSETQFLAEEVSFAQIKNRALSQGGLLIFPSRSQEKEALFFFPLGEVRIAQLIPKDHRHLLRLP